MKTGNVSSLGYLLSALAAIGVLGCGGAGQPPTKDQRLRQAIVGQWTVDTASGVVRYQFADNGTFTMDQPGKGILEQTTMGGNRQGQWSVEDGKLLLRFAEADNGAGQVGQAVGTPGAQQTKTEKVDMPDADTLILSSHRLRRAK